MTTVDKAAANRVILNSYREAVDNPARSEEETRELIDLFCRTYPDEPASRLQQFLFFVDGMNACFELVKKIDGLPSEQH